MLPTVASATAVPEIYVDTTGVGELEAGAEFTVSVKIKDNPGLCIAYLEFDIPDVLTYQSITNTSEADTCTYANNKVAWEYSSDFDANFNGDCLYTLTFTVNEDAAAGSYEIGVALLEGVSSNLGDMDNDVEATYRAGTITIAGEEAPLTFADGEITYDFATLEADDYTLRAPTGGTYYFAGWFSGLTVDGEMITLDEDGRYILSDKATPDETEFNNVAECRPKYDETPESGTYNALWIHEDNTDTFSAMVLEVYENSFKYRKQTYAQPADEVLSNNEAIRKAWTGAAGNGRVKLVKDMKVADVTGHDATGEVVYMNTPLKLDMNGRTLSSVEHTAVDAGEPVLEIRSGTSGNVIESSRGQGTMKQLTYSTSSYGNAYVLQASQTQIDVIRDIDLIANNPNNSKTTGMQIGRSAISRIEHVNVSVSTTGESAQLKNTIAIYSSNTATQCTSIGTMNDCTISSNGYLIYADQKLSNFGTITNCEMTATGTAITSPIYLEGGKIDFGAGNTVTAESSGIFRGAPEINFTSAGSTYQCAESGDVLGADVKVTGTPVAGTTAISENGKLVFVSGFTLKFYSYDGTQFLGADRYRTGETPVDHEVTYDIVGLTTYEHLGWATEMNGDKLVDVTALQADATLYAIREEVTLDPVVSISVADGEAVGYASWDDAIATLGSSQANQQVLIKLLADTAGSSRIRAGYSQITLDLNGNTFTYTGSSYALHYYDGYSSSTSSFTLTSSAAQKGTVILAEGAKGLVLNNAYSGNIVPVVISNVRIEAPYLAANTGWNSAGAVITVINQSANRTELLTMTDVEIVAANCPAVEFSIASTNATCKIKATFTNVKLSGNPVAVGSKGSGKPGATHVNLTVDADSTFKGSTAGTYPIQETNGNFGLTLSYPDGYVLTEGADGWWSYKTPPVINGEKVLTATHTATADNGGVVAITGASQLGILDSLTVNADAANLVFSDEALDSIATAGKDNVNINIAAVADETVAKRISLTVTDDEGAEIEFAGAVEVTMTFSGTAGTSYSIYHLDGANRVPVNAQITDNSDGTFTAVFTVEHFSEYVADTSSPVDYTLSVVFGKEEYKTGETATAGIYLKSSTAENAAVGGFQFRLDTAAAEGLSFNELTSAISGVQITNNAIVWAWNSGDSIAVSNEGDGTLLATATFTVANDAGGKTPEVGLGGTIEVNRTVDGASSPVSVMSDSAKILVNIAVEGSVSNVTGATGENGTYYANGETDVTFKVTIPEGQYVLDSVSYTVNGGEDQTLTADSEDVYTIPAADVTGNVKVTVKYIQYYTVTFNAGANGTLSSAAVAYVKAGESALWTNTDFNVTFTVPTVTAKSGYRFKDEWKNGEGTVIENNDLGVSYVPTGNAALTAQYIELKPISFTFVGDRGTLGIVTGAEHDSSTGKYYAVGDTDVTFTLSAPAGQYVLGSVTYTVNGGTDGSGELPVTNSVYTIYEELMSGEVAVTVEYVEYYTVTFSAGTNGSFTGSPATTAYVKAGESELWTDTTFTTTFNASTVADAVTAIDGYRKTADTANEQLWSDGTNKIMTSALGSSYTPEGDVTLTAQYVKTWKVTFAAGINGTLEGTTELTVDDGTEAATLTVPTVNPKDGYTFKGWDSTMTGRINRDVTYTATYELGTYTLSLPNFDDIEWTVTGAIENGDGTYTATHGTSVTITMTDNSDDIAIDAINVNGTPVEDFEANATSFSWTISGAEIIENISVTIDSTETYTVTLTAGEGVTITTTSKTYRKDALLLESDFGISYAPGYEMDESSDFYQALGGAVTADVTYIVAGKHSSFTVNYDENNTETATHGTDYQINTALAGDGKVVTGVTAKIGETPLTVAENNGVYTISGDQIIGDITVTFTVVAAEWEFIDFAGYAALESGSGTQVAILKTNKLSSGTYALTGYGDMFWSEKYAGYAYIVNQNETAVTLSGKLASNSNAVAELQYSGDINGSGTVTAADATIINAALQMLVSDQLTYQVSVRMRLEMDVDGSRGVATSDVTKVLATALAELLG